jgi:hypothetical protein
MKRQVSVCFAHLEPHKTYRLCKSAGASAAVSLYGCSVPHRGLVMMSIILSLKTPVTGSSKTFWILRIALGSSLSGTVVLGFSQPYNL